MGHIQHSSCGPQCQPADLGIKTTPQAREGHLFMHRAHLSSKPYVICLIPLTKIGSGPFLIKPSFHGSAQAESNCSKEESRRGDDCGALWVWLQASPLASCLPYVYVHCYFMQLLQSEPQGQCAHGLRRRPVSDLPDS